jgi:SAM-dependent methyltransferase
MRLELILVLLPCTAALTFTEFYSKISNRYDIYCIEKLSNCSHRGRCLLDFCMCDLGWTGELCNQSYDRHETECTALSCFAMDNECEADSRNCVTKQLTCNQYPSDACLLHPDYGVASVSEERWNLAQNSELSLWVGSEGDTDRNDFHRTHFSNYAQLPIKHLGNVLEIASGPYTQLKTIVSSLNATLDSITLLEPQMMHYKEKVSGCSYKNDTMLGHRVNFLVGRGEDFILGEAFDTVIMVNGIEHVQDAVRVLRNLYMSIKPGGYIIWHESNYDNYTGEPYQIHPSLLDFIFHPIRLKRSFWHQYLSLFEKIYLATEIDFPSIDGEGTYFIGRKPMTDNAFSFLFQKLIN